MQLRSGRLLESAPDRMGSECDVEVTSTPQRGDDVGVPPSYFANATQDQGESRTSRGMAEGQRLYPPIHMGRDDMLEDSNACDRTGNDDFHASRHEQQITHESEIDHLRRQLYAREEQFQEITRHKDDLVRRMKADFEQCMADLHSKQQQAINEADAYRAQLTKQQSLTTSALTPGRLLPAIPHPKISDAIIAPKTFSGEGADADDWLKFYIKFANFKGLSDRERVDVFSLLLTGVAGDWFATLSAAQTANWAAVEKEFRAMFSRPSCLRYQEASSLWLNPQGSNEKVDVFVTRLKKDASRLNLPEHLLQYAVLNGLRPQIRTHCLTQGCTTLEETIRAARIAEASAAGDPVTELLMATLKSTAANALRQEADLKSLANKVAAMQLPPKSSSSEQSELKAQSGQTPVGAVDHRQHQQFNGTNRWRQAEPPRRGMNYARGGMRGSFNPRQQQRQHYGEQQQLRQQQQQQHTGLPQTDYQSGPSMRGSSGWTSTKPRGIFRAMTLTCNRCGRVGHYARDCRTKLDQQQ